MTPRTVALLAAGALLAGLFVAAGSIELPGLAYAHDLTGGGATATCVDGHVQVRWTFTTLNAGDHTIESVSFDRPVASQSFSGTTVTATTDDTPGAAELSATAIYEDGWQSTSAVSTVVPDDVCPVATTAAAAPPTTTTTVEPHFALPPVIAITDPTTTIIPTVDATVPNSPTSSVSPPPATSQPSVPAPTGPATTAARVPSLPVTGGGQDALVFGLAAAGLGAFLIVATRRRAAK